MKIVYLDSDIIVCVKPRRVLSTDEPGGMPELVRKELGSESADVRTVHRLDRVVGGLMVLALNADSAAKLGTQIAEHGFHKEYCAVVHGIPEKNGTMTDLLYRDKARRMTFVAEKAAKGVQEAILDYENLESAEGMSLVRIVLKTGRTHQIRCQFASRGFPLVGERKYSLLNDPCEIALWSHRLSFSHPKSGEKLDFVLPPPAEYPWSVFNKM